MAGRIRELKSPPPGVEPTNREPTRARDGSIWHTCRYDGEFDDGAPGYILERRTMLDGTVRWYAVQS